MPRGREIRGWRGARRERDLSYPAVPGGPSRLCFAPWFDGQEVVPGAIGFVQTSGELLGWQPQLQVLLTDGGWLHPGSSGFRLDGPLGAERSVQSGLPTAKSLRLSPRPPTTDREDDPIGPEATPGTPEGGRTCRHLPLTTGLRTCAEKQFPTR